MDSDLRCVHVASGEIQAQQVRAFLEAAGISAIERGEALRNTHGLTLDGLGAVEILVAARDADQARALLEAADAGTFRLAEDHELPYRRPDRTEAAEYYFRYIDQVQGSHVVHALTAQRREVLDLLRRVPDAKAGYRYAPDKWSLREVVGHINDTERLFSARAFWFARGFDSPLPSFDQNVAIAAARFDERSWSGLVDEFAAVRDATLAFFGSLPADAWDRRGVASDQPFTVRALAYLAAGHVAHHIEIVKTRYLPIDGRR